MKHILETGTDAASVCLFDPAALPPDFDQRIQGDTLEVLEELAREGRLWSCDTGADGAFLFHLYVDEPVPGEMRPYLHDAQQRPDLLVPGGVLWACGTEYVARDPERGNSATPKRGLGKYSHMGGHCRVTPGTYELTAWRAEWPDEMRREGLAKQLGRARVRRSKAFGVVTGVTLFSAIAGSIVTVGLTIGALRSFRARLGELALWWGGLALLWTVALLLLRVMTRREQDPRRREVEHRFPSIVVHLQRK